MSLAMSHHFASTPGLQLFLRRLCACSAGQCMMHTTQHQLHRVVFITTHADASNVPKACLVQAKGQSHTVELLPKVNRA